MNDFDWARGPDDTYLVPDFRQPRSWKERPIDVRAEAAAQVGPQRRGQITARRIEEWREQRKKVDPQAHEEDLERLGTPEVRRTRRADPYYPSSRILWRGEAGRAFARAWSSYSWGLGPRPGSFEQFRLEFESKPKLRRRLGDAARTALPRSLRGLPGCKPPAD